MDELLHEHYLTLKGFTERLEDILNQWGAMQAVPMDKFADLLADMQRATGAAKEENFEKGAAWRRTTN